VFELVDGSTGLGGQMFKARRGEKSAGDLIASDAGLAAPAGIEAGGLFAFAMQLLDLPAEAARVACRLRRIPSQGAGDDPIRAVGGHLDPA
jgi:hypothetical protein